jgi:hypothetical protein
MNAPFRIPAVTVGLELYRKGIVAIGDAVVTGAPVAWHATQRGSARLVHAARRTMRSPAETMPSLIGQRIRSARER